VPLAWREVIVFFILRIYRIRDMELNAACVPWAEARSIPTSIVVAEQVAEKTLLVVIPSEARNLSQN
jgi:hypothetical protein